MKKFRNTKPGREVEENEINSEMSENELKNVSGGCGDDGDYDTAMICGNCGDKRKWHGRYVNGEVYDCPACGAHTFVGYEEIKK